MKTICFGIILELSMLAIVVDVVAADDDDNGKKKRLHAVLHLDCVPQKSKREKESQPRCGQ